MFSPIAAGGFSKGYPVKDRSRGHKFEPFFWGFFVDLWSFFVDIWSYFRCSGLGSIHHSCNVRSVVSSESGAR
jgi:hypothetical protein